jgi:HTH-type transcriptional regulator/antitoxin HipB
LLGILGVELVLSKPASVAESPASETQPAAGDKPAW